MVDGNTRETTYLTAETTISGWVAAVGHAGMTNNTLYRCSVCGRTYSRKTSYHRHLGEKCGKHRRVKSVKTASTAWKRNKRTRCVVENSVIKVLQEANRISKEPFYD